MRILITGGAGFVGSHTAELLVKNGHTVMVVDNFSTGRSENLKHFKGKIQIADITEIDGMDDVFSEFLPDAVLHLAAQSAITTSINDPQKDLMVNGMGTLNLLHLAKKYNVSRFVFSSTSAVYDEHTKFWVFGPIPEEWKCNPSNPYGISKLAAEHYIRIMFPNHLILRYGNIYGPRQWPIGSNQVIARAFRHLLFGDDFQVVGHGNQKRDWVYVEDIAYANFYALLDNAIGTFNACTGISHSVNQMLHMIEDVFELPARYNWEHTNDPDPRGDVQISPRAIHRELGWGYTVTLREGLERTAEWWKEQK